MGPSLSDIAFLTGMSLPALSQYTSGAKKPSPATERRIAEASAVTKDSVLLRGRVPGFPQLAVAFARDDLTAVEKIAEMSRTFQQAAALGLDDAEYTAFHGAPVRIADPGWEALLHGAAEMSWRRRFPDRELWWVKPSRLRGWWSPTPLSPRRFQSVFLDAPNALLHRRVVVPRGDFQAA